MKNVIDYDIIIGVGKKFRLEVLKKLQEGYVLHGAATATGKYSHKDSVEFAQTVIKYREEVIGGYDL